MLTIGRADAGVAVTTCSAQPASLQFGHIFPKGSSEEPQVGHARLRREEPFQSRAGEPKEKLGSPANSCDGPLDIRRLENFQTTQKIGYQFIRLHLAACFSRIQRVGRVVYMVVRSISGDGGQSSSEKRSARWVCTRPSAQRCRRAAVQISLTQPERLRLNPHSAAHRMT